MSNLPFDIEKLQGTDPEIEVACYFYIPPITKKSKPMECVAVFKRADSDERTELLRQMREKEAFQLSLEKKMAKYEGLITNLSEGKQVDDDVDLEALTKKIYEETEEYVEWFKDLIIERLIRIEKFVLLGGDKVTIAQEDIDEALPALFKWDHYTQGLSLALKDSLSVDGVENAKRKN